MKYLRILNIGNTHIQSFLSEGTDSYSFEKEFSTPECTELPQCWLKEPLAAASVVPRFTRKLSSQGIFVVSRTAPLPFTPSELDLSTVGADRFANAAALLDGILPAISIDFGTAITIEYVTAQKQFCGGAILPGRTLVRKALFDYTAQLPLLELSNELPQIPGLNTADAMRIGTDMGLVEAVRGLILRWKNLGVKRIVACGGDRFYFLKYIDSMEDGGDYFTIRGIRKLWEFSNK